MSDVYAAQSWYVGWPEPEEDFVGTLEALPTVTGPGNRPSLGFLLRTADDNLPTYSAGVDDVLAPLVGHRLHFRDKVVDLTGEGGTREFWIGTISSVAASPRSNT